MNKEVLQLIEFNSRIGLWKFLPIIVFLCSCARQESLEGGPKDIEPPMIIWSKSSSNLQTQSRPQEIKLTFNEWISLNNIQNQFLVSPTLKYPPEFKLKGKTLTVRFDEKEIFKDSTTYLFSLGESIQDITERNIAKNLQFVFSTGDYIDSMWIEGYVINAEDLLVVKDAVVSMYLQQTDTMFTKTKPDLYVKTDEKGYFKISYLKPSKYYLFALKDNNQNNFYDLSSESFAFFDSSIDLKTDTLRSYKLLLSSPIPDIKISQTNSRPGFLKMKFTGKLSNYIWSAPGAIKTSSLYQGDSLTIWYQSKDSVYGVLQYQQKIDSFILSPWTGEDQKTDTIELRAMKYVLRPNEELVLESTHPILEWDLTKLSVLPELPYQINLDSLKPTSILINFNPNTEEKISVLWSSGFVKYWNGAISNADSIGISIVLKESLSGLKVKVEHLKEGENYIFRLLKNKNIIKEVFIKSAGQNFDLEFKNLDPGKYQFSVIEDRNGNQQWDPGSYLHKTQPESILIFEVEELRPDWDVEQKINLEK
ncbi:MAG: Ig-like domain-containing protein [Saprospiraceae bacterium]|nr:Ig-like domain-containing protein [Saprospiraceae bacterium]MBK7810599.1 Ig-like domain-containing protein [Saprospiraceae bacterium]MBK9630191.1 Ig-like domain-containing protein [Saprospiraceae bacterium]